MAWSPFIGQPETGESNPVTLERAIHWHDRFSVFLATRARYFPPIGDFDQTMAFLDEEANFEMNRVSAPVAAKHLSAAA